MVPIFEHVRGNNGYSYEDFLDRFIHICRNHIDNNRAKAFAFILFDFDDNHIRRVLANTSSIERFNRLSGDSLSVFYIRSDDEYIVNYFNRVFLGAFEIEQEFRLPFVLFFKVINEEVVDVEIVELEHRDVFSAFAGLYDIIASYLKPSASRITEKKESLALRITKYVIRIAVEAFIDKVTE